MKSTAEVCKIVGLHRRTIQEYEKAKVAITPKKKNSQGHFIYERESIQRLWQLRFYKELGLNTAQIKKILEAPDYDREKEMEKAIEGLQRKIEEYQKMIRIAEFMKEIGTEYESFWFGISDLRNSEFDVVSTILPEALNVAEKISDKGLFVDNILSEKDEEKYCKAVDNIIDFCEKGVKPNSEEVQIQVKKMHNIASKEISNSVRMFEWYNMCFLPDTKMSEEIDAELGKGKTRYIYKALQYYYRSNSNNETDYRFECAFANIDEYEKMGYAYDSYEVQNEVSKMYEFYEKIRYLSDEAKWLTLRSMSKLFRQEKYINAFDKGIHRESFIFLADAIDVYCDKYEHR